jgi:hypothetical protein
MRINAENTMNREMNNGREKNHNLPCIQHPSEDSKKQSMGNHLHPHAKHAEQTSMSGSWITKNPDKGDAV